MNNTNPIKCHSHVLFQNWLLSQNEYQKVIELKNLGKYFNNTELWLKGSFYANVGLAYQNTGNNTKAIEYLLIAKRCHKNQNLAYLGIVENNLALAYANLGDHNQAHLRIDSSINICKQTGDLRRLGSSLDTKSNIFLLESKSYIL